MATAQTFIESALRKIQIKGAETPLTTAELADGLEVLNDMGAQLEAEGFELDFVNLASVGTTVPIPVYSNGFYKLQLAARLATEYAVPFNDSLVESLKAARRAVVRQLNRKAVGTTGTYQNIIFGAMELSGVKAGSEPISASEITNAIPRLNDLLTEVEGQGIRLSYQISDGSDLTLPHGIPDWAWSWIKGELAIRLSTSYSIQPNEVAAKMARDGREAAIERIVDAPEVDYPTTLPTGSTRYTSTREFFSESAPDGILTGTDEQLFTDEGLPMGQN